MESRIGTINSKTKVRSKSKKILTTKILQTLLELKSDFKEFKNIIYND